MSASTNTHAELVETELLYTGANVSCVLVSAVTIEAIKVVPGGNNAVPGRYTKVLNRILVTGTDAELHEMLDKLLATMQEPPSERNMIDVANWFQNRQDVLQACASSEDRSIHTKLAAIGQVQAANIKRLYAKNA